jgi:CPA2 family monovalent cation:H+ antiporter-2
MITESELMFQLGAIMLLAFIAASLASKTSQSVMIGYIVIGVVIGPNISVTIFGHEYSGLIRDMSLVQLLSSIGLVMLMFFVGLEFSFSKLKKVRTPAIILAVIDTVHRLPVRLISWLAFDRFTVPCRSDCHEQHQHRDEGAVRPQANIQSGGRIPDWACCR